MEHDPKRNALAKASTQPPADKDPRLVEDSSFAVLRDNVTEALRILVLRRWVFFVPFCIVACLAAVASHRVPRTYESTTIIERRDHPVLMNLQQTAATGGFAMFFRPTLARDFTDPEAMAEVVANLDLIPDLQRNTDGSLTETSLKRCEALGASLAAGVTVRLKQKAEHFDQIQVTYASGDLGLPQKVVDEIKNVYIRRTRNRLTEMLHDVTDYFTSIAEDQRSKVSDLEEDLLTFQAKYIGVDPTDPGSLRLKLTSFESEKSELIRTVEGLELELEMRRNLLERYQASLNKTALGNVGAGTAVPVLARSDRAREIEREIKTLQDEVHEMQLTRRMTDRHPDVVERRTRISRLQDQLKAQYIEDAQSLPANQGVALSELGASAAVEAATGWSAEATSIQLDIQDRASRLESAKQRLRVIETDITKHEEVLENVFKHRKEFTLKQDLIAQARTEYTKSMTRVEMVAGVLNADESERGMTFTELVSPTPCIRPIRPRSATVIVLSILAGVAAGAIFVLLKELFDQTYRTTKQVTRSLGLAILESIDEIVTSTDRAKNFRRRVLYTPVTIALLLFAVTVSCAAAYLSIENPRAYERLIAIPRSMWSGQTATAKVPTTDPPAPAEPVMDSTIVAAQWQDDANEDLDVNGG